MASTRRTRWAKWSLWSLVGLAAVAGLWIVVEGVAYFNHDVLPWDRAEAVKIACAWGGLAPLPAEADVESVKTMGSAFTREFVVVFTAPEEVIADWVQASPALRESTPAHSGDVDDFTVPGEQGSIGGHVRVDHERTRVTIDVSWS